ncbi:MAG: TonB-dependent receptor plug domain-containing protein [Opitutaceae bacterium]|nr:TonB-dependent receptor plug domain-containing protein [Opitutaceae bacterium]
MLRLTFAATLCASLPASTVWGQSNLAFAANPPPVQLPSVHVEAEAERDHFIQGPFLPEVQGTKINVGKKTTVLDFDSLPRITGNNYRQALAQAPGLVLSEETSPLVSIGYRGLEPHRSQFTQVLKDGVPIHADQFGYPEAYYAPPLDTVDRIEFTRGGAGLMYGPQPGGALNYVTHRPRTDRGFGAGTLHTGGSDGYYSTFSYVDGTTGPVGYYGYYNHRQSDGIRSANSDYALDAVHGRVVVGAATSSRLILSAEVYKEEHGEPGGLTFATGPGAVNYHAQREAPSRLFDRFTLDRKAFDLVWERDFSRGTFLLRTWVIDYTRLSRRQGGGGFGTLPSGAAASTNTIERQQFDQFGADARLRFDWGPDSRHVFTAGAQYFLGDSPRTDSRGNTADAENGDVRLKSQRDVRYTPVFAENLFRLGALSVTPGVRVEFVHQKVRELVNAARTNTPLQQRNERAAVPLFGLGVAYDLSRNSGPASQAYLNVSQSYRPMIFTQAVPNGATTIVNGDLEESRAWQVELGVRGEPAEGLVFDASLFQLEFDNQIGNFALAGGLSTLANVGRAVHRGAEAAVSYNLLARRTVSSPRSGRNRGAAVRPALMLYANAMLLDAEFKEGANRGRTPQYAPQHVLRTGLVYTRGANLKLAVTGTLTADSFADDGNTATRRIPAHAVWDLTAEWRVPGTVVRFIGGLNNVLDEDYYSRIRNDGIDPAPGRNVYVGAAIEF